MINDQQLSVEVRDVTVATSTDNDVTRHRFDVITSGGDVQPRDDDVTVISSISGRGDAFVRGFHDCRLEVVSFLSSPLSGASCTADIVDELQRHLVQTENQLRPRTEETEDRLHELPVDVAGTEDCIEASGISDPDANDSALGVSLLCDDSESIVPLNSSSFAIDASEDSDPVDSRLSQDITTSCSTVTADIVSQNATDLLRLAHNNPHIGRLLNELFELMDEEEDCQAGEDDDVMDSDEDDAICVDDFTDVDVLAAVDQESTNSVLTENSDVINT